jgi:hypothetical protein
MGSKPKPRPRGSPPITRTTLPTCRVQYPGGSRGGMSIAPPLARPSPFSRRVGIHISPFEACSDFTHITAHRIARPPKATFVTRLQPRELPLQTARQLPELSTTLWVEPSSTGGTRLRGALEMLGIRGLKNLEAFWKGRDAPWRSGGPVGPDSQRAKKGGRRVATAALSLGRKRPRRAYAAGHAAPQQYRC